MRIFDFGLPDAASDANNKPQSTISDETLRDVIRIMMVESLMLKTTKEEIRNHMPLFGPEGPGIDSIDALKLVVRREQRSGMKVPNSEAARHASAAVHSLNDYVVANKPTQRVVRLKLLAPGKFPALKFVMSNKLIGASPTGFTPKGTRGCPARP